jgi:mRNA interferase ChpB
MESRATGWSRGVVMAVFDRGDIVIVRLDPVEGHEVRGAGRPALVLTTQEFNRLGDVLVAPITQGGDFSRFAGFAVSLKSAGCKTHGVALINKIRMLDLVARKAKRVEQVPQVVIDDAIGRLISLFE